MDFVDLEKKAYEPTLIMQEELVEKRRNGLIPDTVLLVEHEPVYTLGRNAKEKNIVASPSDLERMGIRVVKTGRGGDVTYHGPGQLVVYPIIDLGAGGKGAVWYVGSLEEVIIGTLAKYGVAGGRDKRNRGVWVGNDKIAAIGVRITRHITMHGFSLNVRANLDDYRGIVPCGIADRGVTSLHLLVPDIGMDDVKETVIARFREVFREDAE